MDNGLDKARVIEADGLDSELYFQSLLEQALAKGLLAGSDIERLQYGCIDLLADKTEQYNAGDSSSIRVEKAQGIMDSNLFTIGLWLKTYPNPDDAVNALRNELIDGIYEKGRRRIGVLLASAKATHARLLGQLVDTQNVFYRSTIEDGIKGFFKLYRPDFAAHEIHITADYPAFNPMRKLAGIEFIQAYLKSLYYENMFCRSFEAGDTHHLLCGYMEGYQEHLVNIYEPVLLAALGCVIAGTDVSRLDISGDGAAYLYRLFAGAPESKAPYRRRRLPAETPKSKAFSLVQDAADELARLLGFPPGLDRYVRDSLPMVVSRIEAAAHDQTLGHVFVLPAFPEDRPKAVFSFGDKMEDGQYRKVIEEIGRRRSPQGKVAVIREHVRSLADLEDILLDADLAQEGTQAVLRELGLPELAALSKKYRLGSGFGGFGLREREQSLRASLQGFISALPQAQQEWIAQAVGTIQVE